MRRGKNMLISKKDVTFHVSKLATLCFHSDGEVFNRDEKKNMQCFCDKQDCWWHSMKKTSQENTLQWARQSEVSLCEYLSLLLRIEYTSLTVKNHKMMVIFLATLCKKIGLAVAAHCCCRTADTLCVWTETRQQTQQLSKGTHTRRSLILCVPSARQDDMLTWPNVACCTCYYHWPERLFIIFYFFVMFEIVIYWTALPKALWSHLLQAFLEPSAHEPGVLLWQRRRICGH